MTDLATLGIAVESGQAASAASTLDNLTAAAAKTDKAVVSVSQGAQKADASLGRMNNTAGASSQSFNRATSAIEKTMQAVAKLTEAERRMGGNAYAQRAADIDVYASQLDALRAKFNPLFAASKAYEAELYDLNHAHAVGAIDAAEHGMALERLNARYQMEAVAAQKATAAVLSNNKASALASFELRNLQFQLIDIAQSIPMAFQSPLFFLQNLGMQGAQIGQIFAGQGGLRRGLSESAAVVGSFVSSLSRFGAALVRIGGVATVAALGIGAIRDQASHAEQRTVGWGETLVATFQEIKAGLSDTLLGQGLSAVTSGIGYAFGKLGSAAVDIAELVINSFHAAYTDIVAVWNAFPDMLGNIFVTAANYGIDALNGLVKKSADAVDSISGYLNKIPGVNIPMIGATGDAIEKMANEYQDRVTKAFTDRNAEIERIMSSTPLRDFAGSVVDRISANHALEGLDALANVDFGRSIGGANALGSSISAIGKSAGGAVAQVSAIGQTTINMSQLMKEAQLQQVEGYASATSQLHGLEAQLQKTQKLVGALGDTDVSTVFGETFTGNVRDAERTIESVTGTVDKLFAAWDSGGVTTRELYSDLDLVRQVLLRIGGDSSAVNAFLDKVINGQLLVRQLKSGVTSLSDTIRHIPNKTVTITVVTKNVGGGATQSLYDVPNSSGGTSSVGVTRYGGGSLPEMTGYSVPNGNGGDSQVNVTRFTSSDFTSPTSPTETYTSMDAAQERVRQLQAHGYSNASIEMRAGGGPVSSGTPYLVGERGPEIFVPQSAGTVIDAQRSATAMAQQAFTGMDERDGQQTVEKLLTNIEVNTRDTSKALTGIGGGSSLSRGYSAAPSSTAATDNPQKAERDAYFNDVFRNYSNNYEALRQAGASGYSGGQFGPRSASPFEIALNLTKQRYGFDTGGMIHPGDTQKVEFFKNPMERVIVARPDQFEDRRGAAPPAAAQKAAPVIHQSFNVKIDAGAQVSRDSMAEMRRQAALGVQDAYRAINGR